MRRMGFSPPKRIREAPKSAGKVESESRSSNKGDSPRPKARPKPEQKEAGGRIDTEEVMGFMPLVCLCVLSHRPLYVHSLVEAPNCMHKVEH